MAGSQNDRPKESSSTSDGRVILHVDLDCFYAAVEAVRLGIPRDTPLAVQQWEGLIAVNYAARARGVQRHDRVFQAKQKCPELQLIHVETVGGAPGAGRNAGKVSLERYRAASQRVFSAFRRVCPIVERASIDEAYMDVSAMVDAMLSRPPAAVPPAPDEACPATGATFPAATAAWEEQWKALLESVTEVKAGGATEVKEGSVTEAKAGDGTEVKEGSVTEAKAGGGTEVKEGSVTEAKAGGGIEVKEESETTAKAGSVTDEKAEGATEAKAEETDGGCNADGTEKNVSEEGGEGKDGVQQPQQKRVGERKAEHGGPEGDGSEGGGSEGSGSAQAPAVPKARLVVREGPLDGHDEVERRLQAGVVVAHRLQQEVLGSLGYTVPPRAVPALMEDVPLKKIRNLGGKLGQAMGCATAGQAQVLELPDLIARFGERLGNYVWRAVRGLDETPVAGWPSWLRSCPSYDLPHPLYFPPSPFWFLPLLLHRFPSLWQSLDGHPGSGAVLPMIYLTHFTSPRLRSGSSPFSSTAFPPCDSRWITILAQELSLRMLKDAKDNKRRPRSLHLHYRGGSDGGGGSGGWGGGGGGEKSRSCGMPRDIERVIEGFVDRWCREGGKAEGEVRQDVKEEGTEEGREEEREEGDIGGRGEIVERAEEGKIGGREEGVARAEEGKIGGREEGVARAEEGREELGEEAEGGDAPSREGRARGETGVEGEQGMGVGMGEDAVGEGWMEEERQKLQALLCAAGLTLLAGGSSQPSQPGQPSQQGQQQGQHLHAQPSEQQQGTEANNPSTNLSTRQSSSHPLPAHFPRPLSWAWAPCSRLALSASGFEQLRVKVGWRSTASIAAADASGHGVPVARGPAHGTAALRDSSSPLLRAFSRGSALRSEAHSQGEEVGQGEADRQGEANRQGGAEKQGDVERELVEEGGWEVKERADMGGVGVMKRGGEEGERSEGEEGFEGVGRRESKKLRIEEQGKACSEEEKGTEERGSKKRGIGEQGTGERTDSRRRKLVGRGRGGRRVRDSRGRLGSHSKRGAVEGALVRMLGQRRVRNEHTSMEDLDLGDSLSRKANSMSGEGGVVGGGVDAVGGGLARPAVDDGEARDLRARGGGQTPGALGGVQSDADEAEEGAEKEVRSEGGEHGDASVQKRRRVGATAGQESRAFSTMRVTGERGITGDGGATGVGGATGDGGRVSLKRGRVGGERDGSGVREDDLEAERLGRGSAVQGDVVAMTEGEVGEERDEGRGEGTVEIEREVGRGERERGEGAGVAAGDGAVRHCERDDGGVGVCARVCDGKRGDDGVVGVGELDEWDEGVKHDNVARVQGVNRGGDDGNNGDGADERQEEDSQQHTDDMADRHGLVRPVYRALVAATKRLASEIERHKTTDVFSLSEVSWLQDNTPGALRAIKRGRDASLALLRQEFRMPLTGEPGSVQAQEDWGQRLDQALSLLAVLNRRLAVLQTHSASDHSDNLSHGVRVEVQSKFQVMDQIHFGALYHYRVRIRNEGVNEPVQLVSRQWVIKDFDGNIQEVIGPGVIGKQPILDLGSEFDFLPPAPFVSPPPSPPSLLSFLSLPPAVSPPPSPPSLLSFLDPAVCSFLSLPPAVSPPPSPPSLLSFLEPAERSFLSTRSSSLSFPSRPSRLSFRDPAVRNSLPTSPAIPFSLSLRSLLSVRDPALCSFRSPFAPFSLTPPFAICPLAFTSTCLGCTASPVLLAPVFAPRPAAVAAAAPGAASPVSPAPPPFPASSATLPFAAADTPPPPAPPLPPLPIHLAVAITIRLPLKVLHSLLSPPPPLPTPLPPPTSIFHQFLHLLLSSPFLLHYFASTSSSCSCSPPSLYPILPFIVANSSMPSPPTRMLRSTKLPKRRSMPNMDLAPIGPRVGPGEWAGLPRERVGLLKERVGLAKKGCRADVDADRGKASPLGLRGGMPPPAAAPPAAPTAAPPAAPPAPAAAMPVPCRGLARGTPLGLTGTTLDCRCCCCGPPECGPPECGPVTPACDPYPPA
ncbi:unnamed protein product [Closterium sp. NIES-65]|nr:unnamed protein product [Closterium sp. NIES-65]